MKQTIQTELHKTSAKLAPIIGMIQKNLRSTGSGAMPHSPE